MAALMHKDDYYESPKLLVKDIEQETGLRFNIDIAAHELNRKCHYFIGENEDALKVSWKQRFAHPTVGFLNPPRSKNGKFVNKAYEQWEEHNMDIVMLLCWNDLGNKYGEKLLPHIINGDFKVKNLGKIIFDKKGIPSEFPSRLTYFWCWFKSQH